MPGRSAETLGVRYVLEGSVQRSGNQVRINAQLVDAETGAHLWADRFDRDIGDLFALQNEITARIARALQSQLAIAEASRPIEHPDALDYMLRGRALLTRPISKENYDEAVSLFETALALDPKAADAAGLVGNRPCGACLRRTEQFPGGRPATGGEAGGTGVSGFTQQRDFAYGHGPGASARNRGAGKPSPNSRRRSRSIAAAPLPMRISAGASF